MTIFTNFILTQDEETTTETTSTDSMKYCSSYDTTLGQCTACYAAYLDITDSTTPTCKAPTTTLDNCLSYLSATECSMC